MSSKETKEEKTSADNAPVSHEKAETKGLKTAPAEKLRWKVIRFLMYFVMFFFLIAGRTAEWALDEWGDLTLDEIMFTLTQPLKGASEKMVPSGLHDRGGPVRRLSDSPFLDQNGHLFPYKQPGRAVYLY